MTRTLFAPAAVILLAGCATTQSTSKPASPSGTPTGEQIESIRQAFRVAYPNARVGVVTAVLAGSSYVLVTQIDTTTVRPGTIFTFLDANQAVITNGVVAKSDKDGLTIKCDPGTRSLRVGDAAVKF